MKFANQYTLDKLDWPVLIEQLAALAQTEEGIERCRALAPDLDAEAISIQWGLLDSLRALVAQMYVAPIGAIAPVPPVLKAASLGQILDGPSLRAVADLLHAVKRVARFAEPLAGKSQALRTFAARAYPLPKLFEAIDKAIAPDGELNDNASEKLSEIRRAKISLRKRIEEALTKLMLAEDIAKYLQDNFFTVRSERYVIPMRLDGRGRIRGSILDTSDSGQTLFLEPAQIAPLNEQLQELDLEEKLEIIRIFRDLTEAVSGELEILRTNYDEIITLDILTAKARLAAETESSPVILSDVPVIDLREARHPLIRRPDGKHAIPSSVSLKDGQTGLVVSGPNAGGKTVVLKTIGILHIMARAGLLVPADPGSRIFLYDRLFLEMGDTQSLKSNLSTFSGHLHGLKPVLSSASARDLVLLDELAVGTDPITGAAIATAVLEHLADRHVMTVTTTHFDALKGLAVRDARFRNGSMEFSVANLKPTYKLILDIPGQSFGIEVAEQIGLPESVTSRARELRGASVSILDQAAFELMKARDEARERARESEAAKLAAESEKARWEQEREAMTDARRKVARQLADKFEADIAELKAQYDTAMRQMRQAVKSGESEAAAREALTEARRGTEKSLAAMESVVKDLNQAWREERQLPGAPAEHSRISAGTPVFVLPLGKAGKVLKATDDAGIEVEVGIIKLRVPLHDLRILSAGEAPGQVAGGSGAAPTGREKRSASPAPAQADQRRFVMPTAGNSIDLRGKSADDAVELAMNFIDKALLRGDDAAILIHGHGTAAIKNALRHKLSHDCPYDVKFRPGLPEEGGDGVTVVWLR